MFTQVRGVKNAGSNPERGEPGTVALIEDTKIRLVHYFDDRGRPVSEVVMICGDRWFLPPNSIEWAEKLRPLPGWQRTLIEKYDKEHAPVAVQDQDAVSIMEPPAASIVE